MAGEQSPRSSNSRWLPTSTGTPSTIASAPRPGSARKPSPGRERGAVTRRRRRMMARAIGCSDRASRAAARRQDLGGPAPSRRMTSTTSGRPCVSVPVLSNATTRTAAARSRWTPPLISTPRRAAPGQRRHDRHRRRDDQRARAGNHQQHERPVEPVAERPAEQPAAARRPRRRRRRSRPGCSSGRSARRRPATGARWACAVSTRLMIRAIVVSRRTRVTWMIQRAVPVDRPGEHLVAGLLVDRAATRR